MGPNLFGEKHQEKGGLYLYGTDLVMKVFVELPLQIQNTSRQNQKPRFYPKRSRIF